MKNSDPRTGFMDRSPSGAAIGIIGSKTPANVGTLWRSAALMGCQFIFTVGARYGKQATDTIQSWKQIPMWQFETFEDLQRAAPKEWQFVAVEMIDASEPVQAFNHPNLACYCLGAEDHGLPSEVLKAAHRHLYIYTDGMS